MVKRGKRRKKEGGGEDRGLEKREAKMVKQGRMGCMGPGLNVPDGPGQIRLDICILQHKNCNNKKNCKKRQMQFETRKVEIPIWREKTSVPAPAQTPAPTADH